MASCNGILVLQSFCANSTRADRVQDLVLQGPVRSPDHIFYFTLRDALNFGVQAAAFSFFQRGGGNGVNIIYDSHMTH